LTGPPAGLFFALDAPFVGFPFPSIRPHSLEKVNAVKNAYIGFCHDLDPQGYVS
jgi:hypothetical protein